MSDAPRSRGRPPSAGTRAAILSAAGAIIAEKGLPALTIEGVAARARVGKPTIYRHWQNRFELAMAALMAAAAPARTPDRPGPALARLEEQLRTIGALFATPAGRHVAAMLAASQGETELGKAFRSHFVQARRDEGRALLEEAVAAGELRADLDRELALDLVYGPLHYRLAMRHAAIGPDFARALLALLIEGFGPRP